MVKKHGREAADGALKVDQDTSVQAATDMCADLSKSDMGRGYLCKSWLWLTEASGSLAL